MDSDKVCQVTKYHFCIHHIARLTLSQGEDTRGGLQIVEQHEIELFYLDLCALHSFLRLSAQITTTVVHVAMAETTTQVVEVGIEF